ncbi:hypothetical protein ES319_D05G400000v1 [Gossypium barbadense]|uniref:Bet v I/Major latex protein domain-containing protein n=1 Tax=Gossypium barbadense TaxID=3634 RepID=A0A5J5RNT5_GOSBA|nr:hypothetical protein ES319_D05G400000v1 [Gossypium barbadense]
MLKQISFVFFVLLIGCYIRVNCEELKHLTNEVEVNVPANLTWELYRHLGISKLAAQQLKHVIQRIQVLKGNSSYTEIFNVIDDQKRVKVAQTLEGGCLEIGCSIQLVRFDIIEKSPSKSIIKSDISYAVKKEFQAKDPKPNIQCLAAVAQVAKYYLERANWA